jgi:hypothetical protein
MNTTAKLFSYDETNARIITNLAGVRACGRGDEHPHMCPLTFTKVPMFQ